ncbi:MAG: proline iminopeptidase [Nitrososphaerota archaeon]
MSFVKEGYLDVFGARLYYKSFGRGNTKLLCLHGGPGATHDYLLPLADLAGDDLQVIFYDQAGCGRSTFPEDMSFLSSGEAYVNYGVEEVEEVRRKLDLGRPFLLGSSYGGLLALAYAVKYQHNLLGLIVASGLSSVPLTVEEMQRLKDGLPKRVRQVIERYERLGDYRNEEYQAAVKEFYKRHLCRLNPWPAELEYTFQHISERIYLEINGPNEFTITGKLKDYDITEKISSITIPTLITVGKYDEVTPRVAQVIHERIKGSKLVIFQRSSHVAFWEERDRYLKVVKEFIDSVLSQRRTMEEGERAPIG